MAAILGVFPAALIAARGGMSANAFYRQLQSQGIGARRSEVLSLYKIATGVVATGSNEMFGNPQQIPDIGKLAPWPTKTATGVIQNITLIYRENITGAQVVTKYQVHTANGVTREEAVARAVNAYTGTTSERGHTLIEAFPTSAYRKGPIGI